MRVTKSIRRFSIRALLVATAVFATGTQWWTGTPKRTAAKLADAIASRDSAQVASLSCNTDIIEQTWRLDGASVARTQVTCLARSLFDFVSGRQLVELRFLDDSGRTLDTVRANVVRFHISNAWNATPIFSTFIAATSGKTWQYCG